MKTLDEWVEFYKKKTGDDVDIPSGFSVYYLPNRGFCLYAIDIYNDCVVIYHCCGDGKFWRDLGHIMAIQHGLGKVKTLVTRNPIAYMRSMGFKILKNEIINDKHTLYGEDEHGRNLTMIYECNHNKTGKPVYSTTMEV